MRRHRSLTDPPSTSTVLSSRSFAVATFPASMSPPTNRLPAPMAATAVVPDPRNGSMTSSPGSEVICTQWITGSTACCQEWSGLASGPPLPSTSLLLIAGLVAPAVVLARGPVETEPTKLPRHSLARRSLSTACMTGSTLFAYAGVIRSAGTSSGMVSRDTSHANICVAAPHMKTAGSKFPEWGEATRSDDNRGLDEPNCRATPRR